MRFLAICLLLVSQLASAKIGFVTFDDLVSESEFIVYGIAKEIKISDYGDGYSKIKIIDVAKGDVKAESLIVNWSSEVHDQRIYEANGRYVLFLKKDDSGNLITAIHGRGFLKVQLDYSEQKNHYINPFLLKEIPSSVTVDYYSDTCGEVLSEKRTKIILSNLIDFIKYDGK